MPTLADFREELLKQPEQEAHDLALSLELFATGSLDAFSHQSNVNVNNRIACYDILAVSYTHLDVYKRQVLFLKEYPSFLKDELLSQLTDFSRSMMVSVDVQPIPTDEAVKERCV